MKVAWFSSAAEKSLAARFTERLLPLLSSELDIQLFSSETALAKERFAGVRVLPPQASFQEDFDIIFHQCESCPEANSMRVWQTVQPGFSYFHQFLLTSFGPDPILASPWKHVARSFLGDSSFEYDRHQDYGSPAGLALREASLSYFNLFSDERELGLFENESFDRLQAAKSKACVLPFPGRSHQWIGSAEKPKIVMTGGVEPHFQNHVVLQALESFDFQIVWHLDSAEHGAASGLVKEILGEQGASALELFDISTLSESLASAEAAIVFSGSPFSCLQPALSDCLLSEAALLLLDFGAAALLPADKLMLLKPGRALGPSLQQVFAALERESYRSKEKAAFFSETHSTEAVAAELLSLFRAEVDSFAEFRARWSEFSAKARSSVCSESFNYVQSERPELVNLPEHEAVFAPVFDELGWSAR